jgi:hypothetical protein
MFRTICIVGLLGFALVAVSQIDSAHVPDVVSYQGRLTDTEGKPIDTTVSLTFRIFDKSTGGNLLWNETHSAVVVTEGVFTVELGPLDSVVFAEAIRYLEITIGADQVILPRIQFSSAPFSIRSEVAAEADRLDGLHSAQLLDKATYDSDDDGVIDAPAVGSQGVPVGTVIDWWRPNESFPIPQGFQVCDGSAVTDPDSPFYGHNVPDLSSVFIMGVTDPDGIGLTGGSPDHQHTVDLEDHSHNVPLDHDHGMVNPATSTAPNHVHIVSLTHDHAPYVSVAAGGHAHDLQLSTVGLYTWGSSYYWSTSTEAVGDHVHTVDLPAYVGQVSSQGAGTHNHTVPVDLPTYIDTVGTLPAGGGAQVTSAGSSLPPYFGLLKLMRIK